MESKGCQHQKVHWTGATERKVKGRKVKGREQMEQLDVFSVVVLSNLIFADQYQNNKAFPILVFCSNSSLNHTCMKGNQTYTALEWGSIPGDIKD